LEYWEEKSEGGLKERWQMEKVFDINRRFRYWLRNNDTFAFRGNKKSKLQENLEITKNLFGDNDGLDPDKEVEEVSDGN